MKQNYDQPRIWAHGWGPGHQEASDKNKFLKTCIAAAMALGIIVLILFGH